MIVKAIKCDDCGDVIFSRTIHDMRHCSCKAVAIDGGRDYVKLSFKNHFPKPFDFELHPTITDKLLFEDWTNESNMYGLVKDLKR